jgi:hypothetical protein
MDIDVDSSAVDTALASMIDNLAKLPQDIQVEMVAWQSDDMHRQYPNLELPDDNTFETDIWPRSRLSKPHRPTGRPRGRPPGRLVAQNKTSTGRRAPSTRDILRPELWDALVDRMHGLLGTIGWKSNGS